MSQSQGHEVGVIPTTNRMDLYDQRPHITFYGGYTPAMLASLQRHTTLVHLQGCYLTSDEVLALVEAVQRNHPQLTVLKLCLGCSWNEHSLAAIGHLPALHTLILTDVRTTLPSDRLLLCRWLRLHHLTLGDVDAAIVVQVLRSFSEDTPLRTLTLTVWQQWDAVLPALIVSLGSLRQLQELALTTSTWHTVQLQQITSVLCTLLSLRTITLAALTTSPVVNFVNVNVCADLLRRPSSLTALTLPHTENLQSLLWRPLLRKSCLVSLSSAVGGPLSPAIADVLARNADRWAEETVPWTPRLHYRFQNLHIRITTFLLCMYRRGLFLPSDVVVHIAEYMPERLAGYE